MRYHLTTKHSTGAERRFHEVLKELRVPFRHRWMIDGIEVDFLIGLNAIEIDGHTQIGERNHKLAALGYIPHHLSNKETYNKNYIINFIKQIYGNN